LLIDAVNHLPPRIAMGMGSDPLFVSLHEDPRLVALITQAKKKDVSQASAICIRSVMRPRRANALPA
jgi:hypothetical protein